MDFTCYCCSVAFKDGEIQRLHYKTDWHRYNLMRKVADLPPVTSEAFQNRVLAQRATDKLQQQNTKQYCKCCRKAFSNFKTYENHLSSKKHKELESNYVEPEEVNNMEVDKKEVEVESDDEDVEEVDSDEWDEDMEVDVRKCLFCLHHSKNLVNNLKHMSEIHSFFIPDIEFCIDMNGLVEYLGQKIEHGFICLWCNEKGKTYYTAEAVRKHMLDKGHTKMLHEGIALAEYTDFYDYSASYPDEDETEDSNEEVEIPEMEGNEFQLVLPSGSVIGHRSLMRYYQQNIDPNRVVANKKKNTNKFHKVLATYRALGWSPEDKKASAMKIKDIRHMKRLISKYRMKLGTKANKLQNHFRPQIIF